MTPSRETLLDNVGEPRPLRLGSPSEVGPGVGVEGGESVKHATMSKLSAKTAVVDVRDDEKPNINNESLMISLGDAAQMLGIHRTTAWAIHDRGDFPVPVIKVGGHWRVVRAHLHHFIYTGERVTLPFNPVSDSTLTAR